MEPKKNPKADVHRNRTLLFNFSLVLSLLVAITAFKWSAPIPPGPGCKLPLDLENDFTFVPSTDFTSVPDPPMPKRKAELPIPSNPDFVEVKELIHSFLPLLVDPSSDRAQFAEPIIEIPHEIYDTITIEPFKVQTPPHPVGGYESFYRMLSENLIYPKRAVQNRIAGKVFVQFTIDRNGDPVKFNVIRGISMDCDREAIRVLSLTKWTPGKQRGKPVNVRMVLPVNFVLRQK